MPSHNLTLSGVPGTFPICRLEAGSPIPEWAIQETFVSITRTSDELSIVIVQECVPEKVHCQRDWRALKIEGPLDFSLVGVSVSVYASLAEAGISVFAISTYDTDYVPVRESQWKVAAGVLSQHHTLS